MAADQHPVPATGALVEIGSGDQRAVITELGATLRVYEVGRRRVIEPFDGPATVPIGCQGEILAPWPNRTVDGAWRWDSTPLQLSVTEPERGHALHGLVRTLAWAVSDRSDAGVTFETRLLAQPGWPSPLHFTCSYELGSSGLTSTLTARNIGAASCPYGAATHPYLAIRGGLADDAVLDLGAGTWLATDERLAPVERRASEGTNFDFDGSWPIGDRRVDNAFTDLRRGDDGRVEARLTSPDGGVTTIWGDSSIRWWQLFTGDALPLRWRRRTIAVEPMTCAPDALNSGDDLVTLRPAESHSMTWGLSLEIRAG